MRSTTFSLIASVAVAVMAGPANADCNAKAEIEAAFTKQLTSKGWHQIITSTLIPNKTPFPSKQILFIEFMPVVIQKVLSSTEVVLYQRLLRQVHVGSISFRFGFPALSGLLRAGGFSFLAQTSFSLLPLPCEDCLPTTYDHSEHKYRHYDRSSSKQPLVPPYHLLKPVNFARRTGQDGLIAQMSFEVLGQIMGRTVAARPVLLHRLHHDPVQVVSYRFAELVCRRAAAPGNVLELAAQRRQPRRGLDRILLPDDPLHISVTLAPQVL